MLDNIEMTPEIIEKINSKIKNNITNNTINGQYTCKAGSVNINNTNCNNITNIINNNNIIITKTGHEDIFELTEEEVQEVLADIYNSVNKIIEVLNFNERLPHNHSFCTTDLNSKYISVYDKFTNTINKERKVNIFKQLMDSSLIKVHQIFYNNKKKLNDRNKKLIEEQLKEYTNIN